MLNPQLQLKRFIRDLLEHDEQLIKDGRLNEEQVNSELDYIAVDSLAQAQPMTLGEKYDYSNERITYSQLFRRVFTVDFYGNNAFENANEFSVLINSYVSQRLQAKYRIRVGSSSGIIDLKHLTGQQYSNRYQLELTVHYEIEVTKDLLRIESAEIEVIDDK